MNRYVVTARAQIVQQWIVEADTPGKASRIAAHGGAGQPSAQAIHDREVVDVMALPPLTPKEQSK